MPSASSKARRAVVALPFLLLTAFCLPQIDIPKIIALGQPFLDARKIEWDGGSIPVLSTFHYIEFLDEFWRGTTVSFSPSALGYDDIASWQMFSFLNDFGLLYVVWLVESCRVGNAWTPAYFATFFAFTSQFLAIGNLAPVFYFLCFTFGPSASDLARRAPDRKLQSGQTTLLLPIVLLLHTAELFRAYHAPELTTRHYWTWAWQMTPLYIGIANFFAAKVSKPLRGSFIASTELLLTALSLISAGIWIYTLVYCPYPVTTVFVPEAKAQTGFVKHMRQALQYDEMFAFGSSFLWLLYLFLDLHAAGLMGNDWFYPVALLPVVCACAGPGVGMVFGWAWREKMLSAKQGK